jgi:hypothetical protein
MKDPFNLASVLAYQNGLVRALLAAAYRKRVSENAL